MGKRVYVAGKISGLPEEEYTRNFSKMAHRIRIKGDIPINPVDTSHFGLDYDLQMEVCKLLLKSCDAICLMDNWSDSNGATIEKRWAKELGITVLYEKEY